MEKEISRWTGKLTSSNTPNINLCSLHHRSCHLAIGIEKRKTVRVSYNHATRKEYPITGSPELRRLRFSFLFHITMSKSEELNPLAHKVQSAPCGRMRY